MNEKDKIEAFAKEVRALSDKYGIDRYILFSGKIIDKDNIVTNSSIKGSGPDAMNLLSSIANSNKIIYTLISLTKQAVDYFKSEENGNK